MNNKTYDPQAESLQVFWASQQERLDLLSGMTITDDILHHTAAFGDSEIRAFEKLMQSKPGFDHYDSGDDGLYPECRGCHFHRPSWEDRFCYYEECPYTPGRFTFLPKKISTERSDAIEEK